MFTQSSQVCHVHSVVTSRSCLFIHVCSPSSIYIALSTQYRLLFTHLWSVLYQSRASHWNRLSIIFFSIHPSIHQSLCFLKFLNGITICISYWKPNGIYSNPFGPLRKWTWLHAWSLPSQSVSKPSFEIRKWSQVHLHIYIGFEVISFIFV